MSLKVLKTVLEKEENAAYQHFLLFPTMLPEAFILGVVKARDCWVKGNNDIQLKAALDTFHKHLREIPSWTMTINHTNNNFPITCLRH